MVRREGWCFKDFGANGVKKKKRRVFTWMDRMYRIRRKKGEIRIEHEGHKGTKALREERIRR